MSITKQENGDQIILFITGRVDANTSPELEKAILAAFQQAKLLTLDMEKLLYISSAGLRALLIGQKTASSKGATMEMIHVSSGVRSLLKAVGFTQIMTVR